jgi:hypothetical protein
MDFALAPPLPRAGRIAPHCPPSHLVILSALGGSLIHRAAVAHAGRRRYQREASWWVNQCVHDNKGGAADDVVLKYCTCMNNKMSDNETQSITAWEKSHPTERKALRRRSWLEVSIA